MGFVEFRGLDLFWDCRVYGKDAGLCTQKKHHRNIRALIIRIGFWGAVYYIYNKEPRNMVLVFFSPL